jgi:protease-4
MNSLPFLSPTARLSTLFPRDFVQWLRWSAALSLIGMTQGAAAQNAVQQPGPLPAFGRSTVSNADSTAIIQNPANIAFLPGPELRWTGAFLKEEVEVASQGNAFGLAIPFGFLPLATGLRFDLVSPPRTAAVESYGRSINYQWLTWALAWGGDTASVGFSYQHSYSNALEVHGYKSLNIGVNARPSDYFGISGIVQNINSPTSEGGEDLSVTYDIATVFRPTGTDALDIGLETSFVDEDQGYWVPRGVVDLKIPGLGRLRSDVSWYDPLGTVYEPSWVGSTSLVVDMNTRKASGEVSLGMRYGNGLGSAQGSPFNNMHTEVALRGFRSSSAADNLPYALRVRIEETPSTRGHVQLLRHLWKMADDEPNLQAVLLEVRAAPASSLAHIQELQDAIYHLQDRGKKVLCSLESASGSALYLCSVADRILINPAGSIRYAGLQSNSFYLKGLLDKIGVRADFVRIGEHKSAPEGLSRTRGTNTAIADRVALLQAVEEELSASIARGRHLSVAQVRTSVEDGPFPAVEAKEAKLVDGFAFDDMLEDKTRDLAGRDLIFEEGPQAPTQATRFGPQKRLAIVYVDGDMVDGRSQSFPFLGIQTAGSYTIAESLKQVREDSSIGAVVLRVETGGGSAMAADVLWREVQLLSTFKPVIVSMGTAAASGGYYISAPGTYIYANPLTITGSIGIFFGKLDVAGLLSKIGVNVETFKTSARADAQSPFRPFTDEEREVLKDKIRQFYSLFLRRVADGRHMTKKEVDAVARGRVWTGRQAQQLKLVDGLGGLRQALAKARVMGNLRDDAPIIELPVIKTSIIGKILGIEGIKSELEKNPPPLPQQLMQMARAVAPYALYPADQPLARLEYLPELLP